MGVKELEEELIKARKTLNQDVPLMLSLLDDLTKMTKGATLAGHLETLVSHLIFVRKVCFSLEEVLRISKKKN